MKRCVSNAILFCGTLSYCFRGNHADSTSSTSSSSSSSFEQECSLYMAPSKIVHDQLTLYSGINYGANTAFSIDEVVIPITTPNTNEHSPWNDVAWRSDVLLQFKKQQNYSEGFLTNDGIIPTQYKEYSDFLISGLPSLTLCGGTYEYLDEEEVEEDDIEFYVRHNVDYNYHRRQYELVGETATAASISNVHKYGFVTTKHGLRAGEEIILNCNMKTLPDDTHDEQPTVRVVRDLKWLQQNGICIDNFHIKKSSISHDGTNRGAFAKRNINAGKLIAVSPLIHIDRSQLDIVHQHRTIKTRKDGKPKNPLQRQHGIEYNNTIVLGKQLLNNYVFGHADSNMLLLPMASGVNFINHYKVMDATLTATNQNEHRQPNVGIRWSDQFATAKEKDRVKELRETTPIMQLYEEKVGTFIIEYYALQDIKEGDELLLDYGHAWEDAYRQHQKSNTSKPFRHEIGVPAGMYPQNWMRIDPQPFGDFIANPLEPNHMAPIRWKHNAEVVSPWAFRIGLPKSVQNTLLQYCNDMGITDILRHATVEGNGLQPGTDTYMTMAGNTRWFLQRPDKEWRSNLHWFSPGDNFAHDHYLQALSAAGFDSVLESIGQYLGMDGLVAYHVTFMGVSWSTEGFLHADVRDTGAKVYNVIIPLLLANETGPELDLQSGMENLTTNNTVGRYRYEYHVASMMGDYAIHATSSCDYRTSKQFRMAATVYIADINEKNVDTMLSYNTQAYPPQDTELFLSWAGRHWKPNDPSVQLPKPSADHILVRNKANYSDHTSAETVNTLPSPNAKDVNYLTSGGSNDPPIQMNIIDQQNHHEHYQGDQGKSIGVDASFTSSSFSTVMVEEL